MQRRRGVSLAKGPIALIGLLGIIYGVSALIVRAHGFAIHFPSGHVRGPFWLHLEVNGWTALLFIAAGLALLFSAAAHVTAKTMALLVGIVMIVLAVIGFFQKHGTLGIFASDHWTELVWAAGGVVLLVLAMLPRVGGGPVRTAPVPSGTTGAGAAPTGTVPARGTTAGTTRDTTTPGATGADTGATGADTGATRADTTTGDATTAGTTTGSTTTAGGAPAAGRPEREPAAEERVVRREPAGTERSVADGDEPLVTRTQPVPDGERRD